MYVWRYQLDEDFSYEHHHFLGIEFENEWIRIEGGVISVKKGYAWDGCSPKKNIFGLFTIGTPDGALHLGKPWAAQASLVHDTLCQFRKTLPLTKQQVVEIFDDQLKALDWPLRRAYVWAVDRFGPQDFGY